MEVEAPDYNDKMSKNTEKDSFAIEIKMASLMTTEEGSKIVSDIVLLQEMGYDIKVINKIYILLKPDNIERAIDYMSEINGICQHNFFENSNSNTDKDICFICKKNKIYHQDYFQEKASYLNENNNFININNSFNININNLNVGMEDDNISFNFNSKEILTKNEKNMAKIECNICFEKFNEKEKDSNTLPCGHFCCNQCWLNYFKSSISEGNAEDIKCMNFECNSIISEEFILNKIKGDQTLIDKYRKFKLLAEIINDENKNPCPYPDCESYLEKSKDTKYVKCKNGHEYCFECLKSPHGKSACQNIDKQFLKWKKNKRVKRCPKCKIFIEKNEGCNHMTCKRCKFQWCWICEGPYSLDHYDSGKCQGHQYTRADNLNQANLCFTIQSLFPCFYSKIREQIDLDLMILRYLAIFVTWIFGFFFFAGFSMYNFTENHIKRLHWSENPYFFIVGGLIAFCLFISFQILFSILITPFIFVSFIKPYFIETIFRFLNIGET